MAARIFIDQMGFEVGVPQTPIRVISLVPSQTELLFDLGFESNIVGLTKFCVHPADKVKKVEIIGGTKNFNFDMIDQLRPDLIIGNKEENYKEGIDQLKKKYPVWMSDISNLIDSLEMINEVGRLINCEKKAKALSKNIKLSFEQLPTYQPLSVLYLIWNDPIMVVGKDTFIDEMLKKAGLVNAIHHQRYPEVTAEGIRTIDPDIILLSSEPFPFREKHLRNFQQEFKKSQVYLVDGEMFSWYGSRLLKSANYLHQLRTEVIPTNFRSSQNPG
ncbi:MAG TPA: helical backbone metal receptor [Fulvivirga sp.]|nr:helical backbone metal receptor [Fulvivirga sp.]